MDLILLSVGDQPFLRTKGMVYDWEVQIDISHSISMVNIYSHLWHDWVYLILHLCLVYPLWWTKGARNSEWARGIQISHRFHLEFPNHLIDMKIGFGHLVKFEPPHPLVSHRTWWWNFRGISTFQWKDWAAGAAKLSLSQPTGGENQQQMCFEELWRTN